MPFVRCTSRHLEGVLVCPFIENEGMGYYMILMKHVDLMSMLMKVVEMIGCVICLV